jgi:methionyl-tRNA formyltransferase
VKILFFGSSDFSLPFLRHLVSHPQVEVVGVVTTPPAKKGRGRHIASTCIEDYARSENLPVFPELKLKSESFFEAISSLKSDALMVASYGKLIPNSILELTPWPLNIHPSLLPKYRGPNPILAPILNGDTATGISLMKMTNEMDAGEVAFQETVSVDSVDTAGTLQDKLVSSGVQLLDRCIEGLAKNQLPFTEQNHQEASFTQKTIKSDTEISWEMDLAEIDRRVRAYLPSPRTFFTFRDKKMFIEEGEIARTALEQPDEPSDPPVIGELNKTDGSLTLSLKSGNYCIRRLAPEGKRSMRAYDFIQGCRLKVGECFS